MLNETSIGFVGSVAYHFQDILKDVCLKNEVNIGQILERPIDKLFDFIRIKENY